MMSPCENFLFYFISSSGLPPLYPSAKRDEKRVSPASLKRAAPHKPAGYHAAVLKDVTNINCGNLFMNCINAAKCQDYQPIRQERKVPSQKKGKAEPACFAETSEVVEDKGETIVEEMQKEKAELCQEGDLPTEPTEFTNTKIKSISCRDEGDLYMETFEDSGIINIDSKHKYPQMCSLYAADIYTIFFKRQLDQRPSADYMERLQGDITQHMRGILIDWLVEVSEEYMLVPDTLYLTVSLIDRFLSGNNIERQKLQLLGVTCMLISSKYEEMCALRVEESCSVTDNAYKREEVVQMESRVLNHLKFQLSVPTVKTFLRRFLQAAQASYKVPSAEFEFLANYLAELTLIEYSFLKYLPSLIAASAIFLARWTLDQSDHPWNLTLEHYTRLKAPELKTTVLELQELQRNTKASMLNAVREKYKQPKW